MDATAGSANMVESLSQQNLALEDRVQQLIEEVADLTVLNDMQEQSGWLEHVDNTAQRPHFSLSLSLSLSLLLFFFFLFPLCR